MLDDRQCPITVSLMVVTINRGVASIVFITFQKIRRGEKLGKQRYDELVGVLLVWSTFCQR